MNDSRETNEPGPPLEQVERWMQAVIMHPDGVQAGVESEAARRQLDLGDKGIEAIICPSRALAARERMAIYANAYAARLLECLREEYKVTRATLGDEAFDHFAAAYLQAYPSRSYTLGQLGRRFPQFLAETRPAAEGPELGWPDFLVDLTRLEAAINDVFDGPGIEELEPLSVDHLRAIPPADWGRTRFVLAPCLVLLSFRFPVSAFYSAARAGTVPSVPDPAPSWMALSRRDYIVRRFDLSKPQADLLGALMAGECLEGAIQKCVDANPGHEDVIAAEIESWFQLWALEQFFILA